MSGHTPTPWREWNVIAETGNDEYPTPTLGDLRLVGANNICIGVTFGGYSSLPECNANAAFIVKAVNSHDALVTFFKWAMQEGPWEGGDLEGGGVQDKAESLGLIVSVPYDPEKHGAYNNCGCDAGDPWFEFSPLLSSPVG